ncbi:polyprenyl synthetase family protein, partial [Streptomyces violaceoruber]
MTVVGPFGLSVRDQALEADVQAGLVAVEEGLLEATKSEVPFITEAAQHLVRAGGKRFRPLLVMLSAQFGDPYAPGIVPSAVVVELTHLATLYHDDVMDEAAVRRGVPSANTRWDNSVAVLTGDFLFARASQILADLGPEAVRVQALAFERLVTGQILETAGPQDGRDPVDHYLDVLGGKTGSLVAVSCRFGAMMSGADETVVDVLTQYGERLGVAFQLADDVLDIASDSDESGKTPGTDLREGIPTLPVLRLRERAARLGLAEDLALCELLDSDLSDDARHAEA